MSSHYGSSRPVVYQPARIFLYTLDQVASMLSVTEQELRERFVFFMELNLGTPARNQMRARNIGPRADQPDRDWRISDEELIAWMKRMRFVNYDLTNRKR